MYLEAAQARRAVAQNFARLNYQINQEDWQSLCKGIKRDLQARQLRPNVAVPPRRRIVSFLGVMRAETGSLAKAVTSIFHDGPWTSSGGSFRLAEAIGVDIEDHARRIYAAQRRLVYLEIGGGWAGFWSGTSSAKASDIAGLARVFADQLDETVFLHFTNLTKWHENLPRGINEHSFITAASLDILHKQGVQPATVDILYSQAAAYFEPDYESFLCSAAKLLAPRGILIFNHQPQLGPSMDKITAGRGLELKRRIELGGMNGSVAFYQQRKARADNPVERPSRGEMQAC